MYDIFLLWGGSTPVRVAPSNRQSLHYVSCEQSILREHRPPPRRNSECPVFLLLFERMSQNFVCQGRKLQNLASVAKCFLTPCTLLSAPPRRIHAPSFGFKNVAISSVTHS